MFAKECSFWFFSIGFFRDSHYAAKVIYAANQQWTVAIQTVNGYPWRRALFSLRLRFASFFAAPTKRETTRNSTTIVYLKTKPLLTLRRKWSSLVLLSLQLLLVLQLLKSISRSPLMMWVTKRRSTRGCFKLTDIFPSVMFNPRSP